MNCLAVGWSEDLLAVLTALLVLVKGSRFGIAHFVLGVVWGLIGVFQMKLFSKKSAVLFAGVMVVCAFAVPSASAVSWAPVGTAHTLHSSNLGFVTEPPNQFGLSCASATLNVDVQSAALLRVTSTTFTNCTGSAVAAQCTVTPTGGNFPWTATSAPGVNNVTIDRVDVRMTFDGPQCAFNGAVSTWTGNLSGGAWNNVAHSVTFANDTGLTSDLTGQPVTVTGMISDFVAPFITLS